MYCSHCLSVLWWLSLPVDFEGKSWSCRAQVSICHPRHEWLFPGHCSSCMHNFGNRLLGHILTFLEWVLDLLLTYILVHSAMRESWSSIQLHVIFSKWRSKWQDVLTQAYEECSQVRCYCVSYSGLHASSSSWDIGDAVSHHLWSQCLKGVVSVSSSLSPLLFIALNPWWSWKYDEMTSSLTEDLVMFERRRHPDDAVEQKWNRKAC